MIAEHATLIVVFLVVYLLALVGVGAIKARKVSSQEDFSLAGRGLSTFVLVGTLLATWIGTGSIFGNAEKTYEKGTGAFLLPLGSILGVLVLLALAARIRRFGQFTIQDMLEARFGTTTRVLATLTLVCAYLIIVSYQYRAGAAVLGYVFPGANKDLLLIGFALFVVLYTALAGMFSVAYTDVANGILMVIGIGIAIPFLYNAVGGLDNMHSVMPGNERSFTENWKPWEFLSATVPAFLLILGDANMVQRFFSARDPRSARRAAVYMLIGVAVLETAIILVAYLGLGLVREYKLDPPRNPAHIIIHVAFHSMPSVLAALLISTVVAVVVSTADSYLLSPATSVVRDVYQRFIDPHAGDRRLVLVGRIVVVALGAIAFYFSTLSDKYFDVAIFAYTIYGVGITPVVLATYFWPRANQKGAISSMVAGVGTAAFWKWMVAGASAAGPDGAPATGALARLSRWAGSSGLNEVLPALAVALIVLVVVSLATAPPDPERAHAV